MGLRDYVNAERLENTSNVSGINFVQVSMRVALLQSNFNDISFEPLIKPDIGLETV